jgi:hypothetical protein
MWLKEVFTDQEYEIIVDYLQDYEKYQDSGLQKDLFDIAMR